MLIWIQAIVVLGLCVVFAVAGQEVVRRLVPVHVREAHNDVAGFIYAVIGIAYGVLLGFVVYVVWQDFLTGRDTADREANTVADLYQLAASFPPPLQMEIQTLSREYVRVVIDQEWPLQERGMASERAWETIAALRQAVQRFDPKSPGDQVIFDHGLQLVAQLGDDRRIRLLMSRHSLEPILWGTLIGGGVITVGFTYLFGLRNTRAHRLMVILLVISIGAILFLIHSLDSPFSGQVRVPPTPFELALPRMN